MPLEIELQKNTAALLALAEAIKAAGIATCVSEPKPETAQPKAEPTKSTAAVETKPADPAPADASADPVPALTYADIQKPFLKLVNADKQKAVALLAEFNVPTLKEFSDKPERWAEVLKRIQEVSA